MIFTTIIQSITLITMKEIINFKDVSFGYTKSMVLEKASFSINEGDFVSIIGPNGGGKTTLAKLMLGLLVPEEGYITVYGSAPSKMRSMIGYVPQYSLYDPNFPVSVQEVVLMGVMRKNKFFYTRKERAAAERIIEEVGLYTVRNNAFSDLSGGQRQRVLIARALVSSPRILLMDEPTASVDAAVEEKISTLLEQLSRKMTIILITHDLGFVSNLVTNIICVNRKVNIHPAADLTKEHLDNLYSDNMKIVRHDIKEQP